MVCRIHGIDHVNPNVPLAREKLYNELLGFVTEEYEPKLNLSTPRN